jgi:two-component system sensor histidine kinase BarA
MTTTSAINWEHSLKQVGGRASLAEELITMFVKELPDMQNSINQTYQAKHLQALADMLHKLDGGCSYAGVPGLKTIIANISKSLKLNQLNDLDGLMQKLNTEIDAVLLSAKTGDYRPNK